jgi:predicted lipid-binding transport protein (Tim44 family)
MDGKMDLTTLIFLVMAVVIFFKIRSVLGRRTGDEETRFEQYRSRTPGQGGPLAPEQPRDKVVTLPRREREEAPETAKVPEQDQAKIIEGRATSVAKGNAAVQSGLMDIFRADTSFDPEHFVTGAKGAYEMIVTAFAKGDRRALKDLLEKDVYDGFVAAIGEREAHGLQMDQTFVGLRTADIVEAGVRNGVAEVTVKFVSEMITAVRNRDGEVVDGDPKRIDEKRDTWVFERPVTATTPEWKLAAT